MQTRNYSTSATTIGRAVQARAMLSVAFADLSRALGLPGGEGEPCKRPHEISTAIAMAAQGAQAAADALHGLGELSILADAPGGPTPPRAEGSATGEAVTT